jgi:tetraacyldisaccharide 4'-kinase
VTHELLERLWFDDGRRARTARTTLAWASALYAGVSSVRNALYDRGVLRTHVPPVPALSLGNLSVGGTGKTPVAAWAAAALRRRGAHPAIVLRGYGADEPLVHHQLNPDVPVVVDADRVRGTATALAGGADCVVLDDAFQHRRIARVADWVLVAAEQWRDDARRLPTGPLREPVAALRRASVVVVTRKTMALDEADALADRLARAVPARATAVLHLAPEALVSFEGTRVPLSWLAGRRVLAVAAIGAPAAFFRQLRELGAEIDEIRWPDHHPFTATDVRRLSSRGAGREGVVCTLKDAVKLAPLWHDAHGPLWYVSQAVVVDRGSALLDASLGTILAARTFPL